MTPHPARAPSHGATWQPAHRSCWPPCRTSFRRGRLRRLERRSCREPTNSLRGAHSVLERSKLRDAMFIAAAPPSFVDALRAKPPPSTEPAPKQPLSELESLTNLVSDDDDMPSAVTTGCAVLGVAPMEVSEMAIEILDAEVDRVAKAEAIENQPPSSLVRPRLRMPFVAKRAGTTLSVHPLPQSVCKPEKELVRQPTMPPPAVPWSATMPPPSMPPPAALRPTLLAPQVAAAAVPPHESDAAEPSQPTLNKKRFVAPRSSGTALAAARQRVYATPTPKFKPATKEKKEGEESEHEDAEKPEQEDATWSLTALRLLKLLFGVFTYAHLNACFQFGVPSVNGFPADSWVFMANLPIDQLPATDAVIECYTVAFFQAISNALCTGYGVTTPSRVDELWTMLLSMVIGACLYAVALAFACNVLQNVDHGSRRYQNLLAEANELMRVRCFPKSLRDRVRRLLEIQYPNRRAFSADLLREVSTPMRHEIRMTQCASLFRLTPLFQGADPAFLSAMAGALEVEYAQPGDWLTREHEATRCVFFVQQGRVEVLIDAKPVAELVEGSYIGEIAALGLGNEAGSEDEAGENDGEDAWHDASGADDDPLACAATASVRAIEVTTLFVVGRQRFRAIVSHYPAVRKAMQVVARLRYARGAAAVDSSGVVPSLRTARKQVMVDQASRARWQAISELSGEDVEAYVEAQRLHAIEEQKEKERERLSQACAEEEKRQANHCRYSMFDSASEGCGRKSVAGAGGEVEQLEGAGAKGHRSRSSCVRRLSNPFTSLGPGLNLGQGRRNGGGAALPSAAGRPRDSGGSSADSTAPAPAMNWRANVLGQQNGGRRLSVTDIRRASIAPARKR